MELITNIMAILQQSKMIDHKCKLFSNRLDLVLGDICWSVSVTDLLMENLFGGDISEESRIASSIKSLPSVSFNLYLFSSV